MIEVRKQAKLYVHYKYYLNLSKPINSLVAMDSHHQRGQHGRIRGQLWSQSGGFRGGEEPFYEAGLSGRWAAGSRADILFNSNITNYYQISPFSALFQALSITIQYIIQYYLTLSNIIPCYPRLLLLYQIIQYYPTSSHIIYDII